jgi:4-hydroxybenzoyl-CoA thioesterase
MYGLLGVAGEHLSIRVDVGWGDCDPAGIVFYPRFYAWMDLTSHVLVRALGIPREAMLAPNSSLVGFPVVGAQAEFLAPARIDDHIEVRTWVSRVGRSSLTLRHEIFLLGEPERLLVRGREDRVFVTIDESTGMRAREITPDMREHLLRYVDLEAQR